MNARAGHASMGSSARVAGHLHGIARWIFTLLAAGVLGVMPWLFGGNGPEGYWWIVWSGRLCLVPLALWLVASALRREMPGPAFWVPVICWSLLAVQIIASTFNKSSVPVAPWLGYGFTQLPHDPGWPSTAFKQATEVEGRFWLALGLFALTARNLGCGPRQTRALLWILAVTGAVLALVGIPFKFSGQLLILGKWPAPEWYFYSTFLYHNHWCPFALLAVAAVAALFASQSGAVSRGVLGLMGGVIAASAPFSTSRFGTIAMGVFGLVVFVSWIQRRRKLGAQVRTGMPVVAVSVFVGAILIAASAVYFFKVQGAPGGHRTWAAIWRANPFSSRLMIAEDALPMISAKPWFGWGVGGFGGAFREYQRPETRIVHNQGRVMLFDHPHNDWLEKLVELGFVGFGLLLIPGVVWVGLAWRAAPRSEQDRWILVGCGGLLIFALADEVFLNRAVASSFALLFPLALHSRKLRP